MNRVFSNIVSFFTNHPLMQGNICEYIVNHVSAFSDYISQHESASLLASCQGYCTTQNQQALLPSEPQPPKTIYNHAADNYVECRIPELEEESKSESDEQSRLNDHLFEDSIFSQPDFPLAMFYEQNPRSLSFPSKVSSVESAEDASLEDIKQEELNLESYS